ncbi:MAG: cyclic nucleotide-binding domain-containing protein [Magnetococcales bacterium]|nr:cyclic nucleotide-binding domain-containing protein [Magnetococcales bacterium]
MENLVTAEELINFLATVEGLKEIPTEDLDAFVVPLISIATYETGQSIIARGSMGSHLFILYEGQIRANVSYPDGKSRHFIMEKGSIVGEMSLVSNLPARADVVADKPSTLLLLDIETCQSLMVNLWRVTRAFAGLIGRRMANQA